ncbi:putative methyltransferase domain-containing protein [Phaeomoniella chlamydospora]|uniref:Putative methyltransferase domain-containing protein n=1 Tax=Phaeomoniella chlamydospora TaxID=158046 RepID=A0A0G2E8W9_PHACM|nr:putative methyltransferase domain-containing protein [Phaeomoniella chlamydospora]
MDRTVIQEDDDMDDIDSTFGDTQSTLASLTSSLLSTRLEFGRGYQNFRPDLYYLPNDLPEQSRLDTQHALFVLTFHGNLYLSPLPAPSTNPTLRILDLGCGTGNWAIDMADLFPHSHVIGMDLTPIQPRWIPPNCEFIVDDFEDEWIYHSRFDYIHARMLVVAMKFPFRLFQRAFENLNPGGWFEIQDLCFPFELLEHPISEPPPQNPSAIQSWCHHMLLGASRFGIDLNSPTKFTQYLQSIGYTNIQSEKYMWPLGGSRITATAATTTNSSSSSFIIPNDLEPNSDPTHLAKLSGPARQNFERGIQAFCLMLFTKALGWTVEEVDMFLLRVKEELKTGRAGRWGIPIWVVRGQKPG